MLGLFLGGDILMKKAKKVSKDNMVPDPSVLEGIPAHNNPHAEYAKKDAAFKKRRGGTPK